MMMKILYIFFPFFFCDLPSRCVRGAWRVACQCVSVFVWVWSVAAFTSRSGLCSVCGLWRQLMVRCLGPATATASVVSSAECRDGTGSSYYYSKKTYALMCMFTIDLL